MFLETLGWDERWAAAFEPWAARSDVQPARVAVEFNHIYRVYADDGEREASASGRLKHRAAGRSELPAVGDWVAVRRQPEHARGTIIAILPRRSRFSRKAAGQVTDEQVVAANVDTVFIVMALDGDFNLRRLERYLLLARESGAAPVILLTKPDLAPDLTQQTAAVASLAGVVPVHVVAPRFNAGIEEIRPYIRPGRTCALLGSSGVGKSTIINRLAGEDLQRTREVRAGDSRGRHTTMHRELVLLPAGGLIVDTPGMRELQLWDVGEAVGATFDDITTLATGCRFADCRHREEPQCAVKTAIAAGTLAAERLESYLKLQDEMAHVARQQDERALLDEKRRARVMGKALKKHLKAKRG